MPLRVLQPAQKEGINDSIKGHSYIIWIQLAEDLFPDTLSKDRGELFYYFVIELADVLIEPGLDVEARSLGFGKVEA